MVAPSSKNMVPSLTLMAGEGVLHRVRCYHRWCKPIGSNPKLEHLQGGWNILASSSEYTPRSFLSVRHRERLPRAVSNEVICTLALIPMNPVAAGAFHSTDKRSVSLNNNIGNKEAGWCSDPPDLLHCALKDWSKITGAPKLNK